MKYHRTVCIGFSIGDTSATTYKWHVPYVKDTTKTFHVRVKAEGISNPPSGTSRSFTINGTQPDPYEPNDAFGTAYTVLIKDTISGCMTFDSLFNNHYYDPDYFKFKLTSTAIINIKTIPEFYYDTGYTYNRSSHGPWTILFDSTGKILGNGTNYNASAGTYYCRIWGGGNLGWSKYGLYIDTSNSISNNLDIVKPAPGDVYNGEDVTTISWTADPSFKQFHIEVSSDSIHWASIGDTSATTYKWHVPYIKDTTKTFHVRVTAEGIISNPPSGTSQSFTINGTPNDTYEPNNNIASAHTISLNDTINGCMAFPDTDFYNTGTDPDFYKFTLPSASIINIQTIPEFYCDTGYTYGRLGDRPVIALFDSSRQIIGDGNNYNATAGTYYCKIYASGGDPFSWIKYGLCIKTMNVSAIQITDVSPDSLIRNPDLTYSATVSADTTNIELGLVLNSQATGTITTSVVSRKDITNAPDTVNAIKAISIEVDPSISLSLKSADITIPYNDTDYTPGEESTIAALWLNNSTNEWTPISHTVDSVRNIVIIHTTHFSIYGLFQKHKMVQNVLLTAPDLITYNDTSFSINASASSGLPVELSSSDLSVASISGNTVTIKGAGKTNIAAVQNGNNAYYQAISSKVLTVLKRTVSLSGITVGNKIYDGNTDAALSGGSLDGVISGDNVGLISGTGVFSDKNVGTGKTVTVSGFSLSGGDAANYSLAQPFGLSADITAKNLTLTGVSAQNKIYEEQRMQPFQVVH